MIDPVSVAAVHFTDIFSLLLRIGLGISVFVFLFVLFQCVRMIRSSIPCENTVGIEWVKTCPLDVKVRYSWKIRSPMSVGLFGNRYIFLPEDFVFCEKTKGILEHEVFHLKAHDTLWKVLSLLMVCIHWFNPVIWIFYVYIQAEMEFLCDENVLNLHSADYRAEYAKLLVDFSPGEKPKKVSVFSNFQSFRFLKKRIACIMKHKKPSTLQWCVASIVCTLVVLCASTNSIAYAGEGKISELANVVNIENSYLSHRMDSPEHIVYISMLEGKTFAHKVNPGDMVVYNSVLPWSFEQGQEVSMDLLLNLNGSNYSVGQKIEFGFYYEDMKEIIFSEQIKVGVTIKFTVPKTGDYYFYLRNYSSDAILVQYFTVH